MTNIEQRIFCSLQHSPLSFVEWASNKLLLVWIPPPPQSLLWRSPCGFSLQAQAAYRVGCVCWCLGFRPAPVYAHPALDILDFVCVMYCWASIRVLTTTWNCLWIYSRQFFSQRIDTVTLLWPFWLLVGLTTSGLAPNIRNIWIPLPPFNPFNWRF